jgi:ribosomal protein L37AE/L43A
MPHVVEQASTGRAKCRGCGAAIAKGTWRIGEAVPNMFADGENAEARHWYHPRCAAYKRPEAFLQALEGVDAPLDERDALIAAAGQGVAHHRLPRLDTAERAASGRASCRQCRTPIVKGAWRLTLTFWEDGRFMPAGYLHPSCVAAYAETTDGVLERIRHFTPDLSDDDAVTIAAAIAEGAANPPANAAPADA